MLLVLLHVVLAVLRWQLLLREVALLDIVAAPLERQNFGLLQPTAHEKGCRCGIEKLIPTRN